MKHALTLLLKDKEANIGVPAWNLLTSNLPLFAKFLEDEKDKNTRLDVIKLIELAKEKAEAAIPSLRKIAEVQDDDLRLAATRAIENINKAQQRQAKEKERRVKEQRLKDGIEAFYQIGASYKPDSKTGTVRHVFKMPFHAKDNDLTRIPNVDFDFELYLYFNVTDEGLRELKNLKHLTSLSLHGARGVTDTGLTYLKDLNNLTTLDIRHTFVTGKGLSELRTLTGLQLCGPRVTDAGLKGLKQLKELTTLSLANQPSESWQYEAKYDDWASTVTDAGLKELKELKNLTTLDLRYTKVTDAGVKELKEYLPKCKIILKTDEQKRDEPKTEEPKKAFPDAKKGEAKHVIHDGISRTTRLNSSAARIEKWIFGVTIAWS